MRRVYTTGQVAKMLMVAPRTVAKWFDAGKLRGYRIPDSQDRRIPRESLIHFITEHGLTLPLELTVEKGGNYPNLTRLLEAVARDNDMRMLPPEERLWPSNSGEVEEQAACLTDEEVEVLAAGEEREQQALVLCKGLEDLNEFLVEAFDGALRSHFYAE